MGGGQRTSYFIASVVQWIEKALDVGGPSSIDCKYFWGSNKKQRSCDGRGGGAQRPVWHGNEPKKTGARSARARTRGQNTLVDYNGLHDDGLHTLTVSKTTVYKLAASTITFGTSVYLSSLKHDFCVYCIP
jgi:hypothetical protein